MFPEQRHCPWPVAVDRQRHGFDVPGLARADPVARGARRRRRVPRLGDRAWTAKSRARAMCASANSGSAASARSSSASAPTLADSIRSTART
jgi:hypothetical protein